MAVVGHEANTTNFTNRFSGALDYIFFTANNLQGENLVDLMFRLFRGKIFLLLLLLLSGLAVSNGYPPEDLQRDVALPSPSQPSDHILTVGVLTYSGGSRVGDM